MAFRLSVERALLPAKTRRVQRDMSACSAMTSLKASFTTRRKRAGQIQSLSPCLSCWKAVIELPFVERKLLQLEGSLLHALFGALKDRQYKVSHVSAASKLNYDLSKSLPKWLFKGFSKTLQRQEVY